MLSHECEFVKPVFFTRKAEEFSNGKQEKDLVLLEQGPSLFSARLMVHTAYLSLPRANPPGVPAPWQVLTDARVPLLLLPCVMRVSHGLVVVHREPLPVPALTHPLCAVVAVRPPTVSGWPPLLSLPALQLDP